MEAKLKTAILFFFVGYLIREFPAAPSPFIGVGVGVGFHPLLLKKALIAKPLLLKKALIGAALIAKPLLVKKAIIGAGLIAKPLLLKKGLVGAGLIAKPLIGAGLIAKPLLAKKNLAGGGILAAKKTIVIPVVLGGKVIAGKVVFGKITKGKLALVGGKGLVMAAKFVLIKKVALGKLALVPSFQVQADKRVAVQHELPSVQLELIRPASEFYPVPEPVAIPAGPIEMVGPCPEPFYPVPAPVVKVGKTVSL